MRNTWSWLWRTLLDWTVIIICFLSVYYIPHPIVVFLAIIVIGGRQHALAAMGHEGVHYLISKNKRINDLLMGVLCMWPLFFAVQGFRRFHMHHHRTLGTKDDPELIHKNHKWIGQWKTPFRKSRIIPLILLDFIGGSLVHVLMMFRLTHPDSWKDALGPAVFATALIGVCGYLGAWWIPAIWIGSLAIGFFIAFRIRLWTEHVGTDGTHILKATWWERILFLPHNTFYHYEHHRNPTIPCWDLPKHRDPDAKVKTVKELFRELRAKR